jgi:hypothetical protein
MLRSPETQPRIAHRSTIVGVVSLVVGATSMVVPQLVLSPM